jgi:CheY-like chemotaxis protein
VGLPTAKPVGARIDKEYCGAQLIRERSSPDSKNVNVNVKILLADDHDRMRRMIRQVLVDAHHEVVECADGLEAVRLWSESQPDLAVMDLEMPGMDGLSATRAIRERAPSARVMILTSHDSPALRMAAGEAGVVGYALKSNLQKLTELVAGWFPVTEPKPNSRI